MEDRIDNSVIALSVVIKSNPVTMTSSELRNCIPAIQPNRTLNLISVPILRSEFSLLITGLLTLMGFSVCQKCGGESKVTASIEDQAVIENILMHLLAKCALPTPPDWLPAT
jgi:hypothetical protein